MPVFVISLAIPVMTPAQETEPSEVIPRNEIEIDIDLSYSRSEIRSLESIEGNEVNVIKTTEFMNAPVVLLRYGLTHGIELRLGAQFTINKENYGDPLNSDSNNAEIDGIELAAKFKLAKQDRIFPSMSIIAGSALPPVSTNFFTEMKLKPSVIFCFSNLITDRIGTDYNLGVNFTDWFDVKTLTGMYSLSANYSFNELFGMFGEFYGSVPFHGDKALNYIDSGITFQLRNNIQLGIEAGYGFNSELTEYFINTGIIFRFLK
jgi:hypothetical protein